MAARNLIGLVYNSRLPDAAGLAKALVKSLGIEERAWISTAGSVGEMRDRLESTGLIAVIGGDGTILRTVRVIAPYSVPIVGINLGRMGFMTELQEEEAAEKLPAYVDGSLRVEERMMLEATVTSGSDGTPRLTLHALNDAVVGRSGTAQLLDIETSIDGVQLTTYRADAVIVSTATGSTGYALSAGGPILYPEARLMLVQPVAAHTGLRDGLVLPADSLVYLKASNEHQATLSLDGFADMTLEVGDMVTIRRSPHLALFLRAHAPSTFYAALMRRLGLIYRSKPRDSDG